MINNPMITGFGHRGAVSPSVRHANLLLLCLVVSENCFGLINADAINIAGILNINLLWQILLIGLSLALYWKSRKTNDRFMGFWQGFLLAVLIVLCFVAAYRCMLLTGQPYKRGILPQRSFIVCLLAALLLRKPFKEGMIDCDRLIGGILVLGTVASVLYLAQAAVGSSVTFIHAQSGEKYGGLRLYIDSAMSTTSGLVGLWCCLRYEDWKACIPTVLALGVILFVSKGRLELAIYLIAALIIFLLARGMARARVLLICFAGLALLLFMQTNYFGQVVDSFLSGQIGGSEDTTSIRLAGRDYYDFVLGSVPDGALLGCGYPSDLYPPATRMAGFQNWYLLSDNGIYAFRYVYGNLGVVVVVLLLATCLWHALRGRSDGFGPVIFALFLFLALPSSNLAWWWCVEDWEVMTAIFIALSWQKDIRLRRYGENQIQED